MHKRGVLLWSLLLLLAASCGRPAAPDTPEAAGEALFGRWCAGCHTVEPGGATTLGPNLAGAAARAAANPEGLEAAAWLRREIVAPNASLTPEYQAGLMPANYGQTLSAEQLDALVAYLLTLE